MSETGVLRVPLKGRCGDRQVVKGWALVDDDTFGRSLLSRRWCDNGNGYVRSNTDYLHRVIYQHYHGEVAVGFEVDHISRDKLDNRFENLRAVTRSKNQANRGMLSSNTSGFKCVTWDRRCGQWKAYIKVNGSGFHLGNFDCPRRAADAVNAAYAKHFPHVPPPNPS